MEYTKFLETCLLELSMAETSPPPEDWPKLVAGLKELQQQPTTKGRDTVALAALEKKFEAGCRSQNSRPFLYKFLKSVHVGTDLSDAYSSACRYILRCAEDQVNFYAECTAELHALADCLPNIGSQPAREEESKEWVFDGTKWACNTWLLCAYNVRNLEKRLHYDLHPCSFYKIFYAQVGPTIYSAGGAASRDYGFETTCISLNLEKDRWSLLAPMNIPKVSHSILAHRKLFLYTVGGYNSTGYLHDTERYDIEQNRWTVSKPLNSKTTGSALCIVSERWLYSLGGYSKDENMVQTVEVLDLCDEDAGWVYCPCRLNKLDARHSAATLQISCGDFIVFGGCQNGRSEPLPLPNLKYGTPENRLDHLNEFSKCGYSASTVPKGRHKIAIATYSYPCELVTYNFIQKLWTRSVLH